MVGCLHGSTQLTMYLHFTDINIFQYGFCSPFTTFYPRRSLYHISLYTRVIRRTKRKYERQNTAAFLPSFAVAFNSNDTNNENRGISTVLLYFIRFSPIANIKRSVEHTFIHNRFLNIHKTFSLLTAYFF